MGVSIVVLTIQIAVVVIVACLTTPPSGHGGKSSPVGRGNGHTEHTSRYTHHRSLSESLPTSAIHREFRLHSSSRSVQTFAVRRQDQHEPGERAVNHHHDKTDGVLFKQPSPVRSSGERPRYGGGHPDDFGYEPQADMLTTDTAGPNAPVPLYDCQWEVYKRARLQNLDALPTLNGHDQHFSEEQLGDGTTQAISCGDELCRCYKVIADCSSQPGRLTYIPSLPSYITFLNASNNGLGAITTDTFFANVTNITGLELSRNNITSLNPGAFKRLRGLQTLYMGHNSALNYSSLAPVLSICSLTWLDLNDNRLGPIPADLFQRFPLPGLVNLNLDRNDIQEVDMAGLSQLKGLHFLELGSNFITVLANVSRLPTIMGMNLEKNRLFHFPDTCFNGTSSFPRLEHLILDYNVIAFVPSQVCLPRLRYLSLRHNVIKRVGSGAFDPGRFPSLSALCLDQMMVIVETEANAFSNPNLQLLTLRGDSLGTPSFLGRPTRSSFDPATFDGCTNLAILSLGMNNFAKVGLKRLVGHLESLRVLLLDTDGLGVGRLLDCQAFSELKNLFHLRLSRNDMLSLPDACFDRLPALKRIELSDNEMRALNETAFGPATRNRIKSLDLSGNPFRCDEELTWLCRWMESEPALFANSSNTYACSNLPNATVMDYCLKTPWIG